MVRLTQYFGETSFDAQEWRRYLEMAARRGHVASEYNLGFLLHADGDYQGALYWLEKAVEDAKQAKDSSTEALAREALRKVRVEMAAPKTRPPGATGKAL